MRRHTDINKLLMEKALSVVKVLATYKIMPRTNSEKSSNTNEEIKERKEYIGSGFVVKWKEVFYVVTARHNVSRKKKSNRKLEENDLELEEIQVCIGLSQLRTNCVKATRFMPPTDNSKDRAPHTIGNYQWYHNSDFAVLKCEKQPFGSVADGLLERVAAFGPVDCANVGDVVYVLGIPGNIDVQGEEFAEKNMNGESHSQKANFNAPFFPYWTNVSEGKVLQVERNICSHVANTAAGMSGGPVFALREGKLVAVGLHIGGENELATNYMVPLMMPELLALLQEAYCAANAGDDTMK